MRRAISPEPAGRTAPSSNATRGSRRMEQADLARDAKKDGAMCASASCTRSHGLKEAPSLKRRDKGSNSEQQPRPQWTGRYGGHKLCAEHYRKIVDYIAKHGCLPSEDA